MERQTSRYLLGARLHRQLRNAPTDAERKLWQCLRSNQLDNARFRRQRPYENHILDFVCLERRVIVELDGGQHLEAVRYDAKRTKMLEQAGSVVLRFWNNEVFENIDGVRELIFARLSGRRDPSPPCPPLAGEGSRTDPAIGQDPVMKGRPS